VNSTLDMITRNMAGNSLVISIFIEKDVIQFNNLMHYVKELTDLGVLTSLIGMRCHQPAVKYHKFHTIQPIKHGRGSIFLISKPGNISSDLTTIHPPRHVCRDSFIK
jgi:hypothetical protein